jgi:Ca2+:H+ antiporter
MRRFLFGSLALTPIALAVKYLTDADDVTVFALSALALVPLAWLIGEATEHVAEYTGPGVGGFVNASLGNAPELIIALFAIADGLPNVVRGSIAGSVVSNLLLVLGLSMIAGTGELDRRSLLPQLGLIVVAVLAFLIPALPALHGDPDRHSLAMLSIPVAVVLLGLYVATSWLGLRRHQEIERPAAAAHAWSLRRSLTTLAIATVATALIAEALVGSLEEFGHALGLSDFFVAVVIVAIVGNAAEHGGAIVVARRGRMMLASEIAVSSAVQVAVFVAPAVALLSYLVGQGLPLTFRPVELATMGIAALAVAVTVSDGVAQRREGVALVTGYGMAVVAYAVAP